MQAVPLAPPWPTGHLVPAARFAVKVELFWSRSTNLVTVAVTDSGNGDYFELILDERERALDVFHHPYAHAAARGLDFAPGHTEREVVLDAA